MATFVPALPSTELDELMALVQQGQTLAERQPEYLHAQRAREAIRLVGLSTRSSALAFLAPDLGMDLDSDSPTTRVIEPVQSQQGSDIGSFASVQRSQATSTAGRAGSIPVQSAAATPAPTAIKTAHTTSATTTQQQHTTSITSSSTHSNAAASRQTVADPASVQKHRSTSTPFSPSNRTNPRRFNTYARNPSGRFFTAADDYTGQPEEKEQHHNADLDPRAMPVQLQQTSEELHAMQEKFEEQTKKMEQYEKQLKELKESAVYEKVAQAKQRAAQQQLVEEESRAEQQRRLDAASRVRPRWQNARSASPPATRFTGGPKEMYDAALTGRGYEQLQSRRAQSPPASAAERREEGATSPYYVRQQAAKNAAEQIRRDKQRIKTLTNEANGFVPLNPPPSRSPELVAAYVAGVVSSKSKVDSSGAQAASESVRSDSHRPSDQESPVVPIVGGGSNSPVSNPGSAHGAASGALAPGATFQSRSMSALAQAGTAVAAAVGAAARVQSTRPTMPVAAATTPNPSTSASPEPSSVSDAAFQQRHGQSAAGAPSSRPPSHDYAVARSPPNPASSEDTSALVTESTSPQIQSSPPQAPLSSDPLAADVIYSLSQQLVSLQRAHESLTRESSAAGVRHEEEMKRMKDEAHHKNREIRRVAREKITHLESLYQSSLNSAAPNQQELDGLKQQTKDQADALKQVRELVRDLLKERRCKERKTRVEQALADMLLLPIFQDALLLSNQAGPAAFIPPFASSLVSTLPSTMVAHTIVNDELSSLRLALARTREEVKSLQGKEAEASEQYMQLVQTHKEYKKDANTKRLRMQAQLLAAVRRVQYLADVKMKCEAQSKDAAAYVAQLEGKLLHATKQLVLLQESQNRREIRHHARVRSESARRAGHMLEHGEFPTSARMDRWAEGSTTVEERALSQSVRVPGARHRQSSAPRAVRSSTPPPAPVSSTTAQAPSVSASPARPSAISIASPTSSSSIPAALSSPEADRWMQTLENEVEQLEEQLKKTSAAAAGASQRRPSPRASPRMERMEPHQETATAAVPERAPSSSAQDDHSSASPPIRAPLTETLSSSLDASEEPLPSDPDDTSVGSYEEEEYEFDEEELVRTFGTSSGDGGGNSLSSSTMSLKDQLTHLAAKMASADHERA